MQIQLVKIGNSQGIRLPKAVIEQAILSEELDLQVSEDAIIIRSASRLRSDWAAAAEACRAAGEDQLDEWDVTTADTAGQWK